MGSQGQVLAAHGLMGMGFGLFLPAQVWATARSSAADEHGVA
jgi:hypothetical protein